MGKVSRIPTIGDYTIFFNSLFFVLYSGVIEELEKSKSKLPVIVVSAFIKDDDWQRLDRPCVRRVIEKPYQEVYSLKQDIDIILIESELADMVLEPNRWLDMPNDLLEGQTPRDMIMMGEGQRVYDLIRAIQHGMMP